MNIGGIMGVKNEMTHATENTAASVKKNSNATFQGRQSSRWEATH
jgi:hypothetical protein